MMPKTLLSLLLCIGLATPVVAQEPADDSEPAVQAEPAGEEAEAPAAEDDADEIEDADLDEQTYEEDDDDFIPTEEIPADEPIPFPSNI